MTSGLSFLGTGSFDCAESFSDLWTDSYVNDLLGGALQINLGAGQIAMLPLTGAVESAVSMATGGGGISILLNLIISEIFLWGK